ncbi:Bet v I domain [Macleaya cordata]|uniref:Bet v I domain n=1 Tax=Macleaya cordata TaxID=56857 RepID=A0A200QM26_MACCD|nr:Bet v I domain [Macleaya cordata]
MYAASHGGKHLNIKLDSVDKNNLLLKHTMTDFQGPASDNVDFITSEVKFEAAAGGGCIIKFKTTYHLKGNTVLKEEDLKAGQEKYVGMYKLVEAHLAQNPRLYAN